MGKMPEGAYRDPKTDAIIFKKEARGKNIDIRIIRKILLEMYRVLPEESKQRMKPKVKLMIEKL